MSSMTVGSWSSLRITPKSALFNNHWHDANSGGGVLMSNLLIIIDLILTLFIILTEPTSHPTMEWSPLFRRSSSHSIGGVSMSKYFAFSKPMAQQHDIQLETVSLVLFEHSRVPSRLCFLCIWPFSILTLNRKTNNGTCLLP